MFVALRGIGVESIWVVLLLYLSPLWRGTDVRLRGCKAQVSLSLIWEGCSSQAADRP